MFACDGLQSVRRKTSARWILSDASSLPLRARSVDAIVGIKPAASSSLLSLPRWPSSDAPARLGAVLQAVVRENRDAVVSPLIFPRRRGAACRCHPTLGARSAACFRLAFAASRPAKIFYSGPSPISLSKRAPHPASFLFDPGFRAATSASAAESAGIARGLASSNDLESGSFARIAAALRRCPYRRRRLRCDHRGVSSHALRESPLPGKALNFVHEEWPRQREDEMRPPT